MPTLQEIAVAIAAGITNKTAFKTIRPPDVGNNMASVLNEFGARGVLQVANTAALATTARANTKVAFVAGVGLFYSFASGSSPDGSTTFASPDAGFLWKLQGEAEGGGGLPNPDNPSEWLNSRYSANPVINYLLPGNVETTQYAPSPIVLPNGEIWVYVKGDTYEDICAYKSTDNGATYSYQGQVLNPTGVDGDFDKSVCTFPFAHFDPGTNKIHLYYQAGASVNEPPLHPAIGHATADVSDPKTFTRVGQAITYANLISELGFSFCGFATVSTIVKKGGTMYIFGCAWNSDSEQGTPGVVHIFRGEMPDYNTIQNLQIVLSPDGTTGDGDGAFNVAQGPTIFLKNGKYYMIYTEGHGDDLLLRRLVSAYSDDLVAWTKTDGILLNPTGGPTNWEGRRVYAAQLLKKAAGNFDEPLLIPLAAQYGGPETDQALQYYMLFYSGSLGGTAGVSDPFHDNTGLLYIMAPEIFSKYAIVNYGNDFVVLERGNTVLLLMPSASAAKRGVLTSQDFTTFNNKAQKTGEPGYLQNNHGGTFSTPQANADAHIDGQFQADKKIIVGSAGVDAIANSAANFDAVSGAGAIQPLQLTNVNFPASIFLWQLSNIAYLQLASSFGLGAIVSSGNGFQFQSLSWAFRDGVFPFNQNLEIDAANSTIYLIPYSSALTSNQRMVIGSHTPLRSASNIVTFDGSVGFTGKIDHDYTYTPAATTGDQTINKPFGTVRIAAAGTSVKVTNSFVSANSVVRAGIMTDDTTAVFKNCAKNPAGGDFTIKLSAACTAETEIWFEVLNN